MLRKSHCTWALVCLAAILFVASECSGAPTVSFASPPSKAAGGADFTLLLTGNGFTLNSVARVNGADRETTFVTTAQLMATILATDIATPGLTSLTVFDPATGESNALNFPIFISQPTNDLILEPVSQLIYASVPGSAGSGGNSIVSIDPVTGVVGSPVFVGSEPGKLALADDNQALYVALDGAAAARRFDIPSQTPGVQFSMGSDPFFGPMFADDIAVAPGNPDAVAISRKFQGVSPRHAGVAVFDNGVIRPTQTPGHTGSNVIQYSGDPATLYGYNNETTDFGFRTMLVDANGVTITNSTSGLIVGFGVDIRFDGGLIYSTTGRVIDPVARVLVGTFPGIDFGAVVQPDSASGRVFFLKGNEFDPVRTLLVFDPGTFLLLGSLDIPGVSGRATSLIRWGTDGLAFRTSSNQVFVLQSPVSVAPAALNARP
jgi:hypothetical protein